MNEYTVKIHFVDGTSTDVKIKSYSRKNAIDEIITQKGWFFPSDNVAINMEKVTHVSIA